MNVSSLNSTPAVAYPSNRNAVAGPADAGVVSSPSDAVTLSKPGATVSPSATATPDAKGAPAPAGGKVPLKEWTVMMYVASDNNLYKYQMNNITDAEKGGSSDQMNVVAELSRVPVGGGVQRVAIEKCAPGKHSPVTQELGDVDMGDPKTLADFIKWTKATYPAKHYAIVFNDHGNGWQGTCADEKHDGWLTLPKLEQGLKDGRTGSDGQPLDVVGFDACLMANIETIDQLKGETKFMVGSEETEGGAGWQYNKVLSGDMLATANKALHSRDGLTAEQFAKTAVNMAKNDEGDLPTMTAFDMSKAQPLIDSAKAFGQAIDNTKISSGQLGAAATATQGFTMEKDLTDFADRVGKISGSDATLSAAAADLKGKVADSIIAEAHSKDFPNAHGLTVELNRSFESRGFQVNPAPELAAITFDSYQNTKFDKDVDWSATVNKINSGSANLTNPWPTTDADKPVKA